NSLREPPGSFKLPPLVRFADTRFAWDQKNSPSRFRFRPPLPLTFPLRVLPSDSVSTYLRSVLGASSNLTCRARGSRAWKKPRPQFAYIPFSNVLTAFLATCGQGCGKDSTASEESPEGSENRIGHALHEPNAPSEQRPADPHDEDGRCEPHQAARDDVARVVRTDENAPDSDEGSRY